MKKFLVMATLVIAGLMSAKNGETKLDKNVTFIQYGYLYQSTCGWTFSMYSDS